MTSLHDQIKCVQREIEMREDIYPRMVKWGKMDPQKADEELKAMKSVLSTLKEIRDKDQMKLF